jgi:8-hydroxy-5-deazaflavin:NADPH oxidoreductase
VTRELSAVKRLPISGDEEGKRTVAELIDQIGFDPLDAGILGERKQQTGVPAYIQGLPIAELRARLAA